MRPATYYLLLTAALFVWAGLVAGISFLEAPLKFTAPHITVALGVGIGRVVFHALNKAEFALCFVALGCAGALRVATPVWRGLVSATLLLLVQTAWLLPVLDARADALLTDQATGPASYHHAVYMGVELAKLALLLLTGVLTFRYATGAVGVVKPAQPAGRASRRARRPQLLS
jgi:hypothetical protein